MATRLKMVEVLESPMVEVLESPSLFFAGMAGTRSPIAVAHDEGYANFKHWGNADQVIPAMRFTDNFGKCG